MKYLIVALLMVAGCGGKGTKPGDPYWIAVDNEGSTPRIRDGSDLGDEVWAEWWNGGHKPWCRIAFDRAEWKEWHTGARALWIQYDFSSGATGLYAPHN